MDAWWGLAAVARDGDVTAAEDEALPSHWMRRVYRACVAGDRLDPQAAELYRGLLHEYPGCEHLALQAAHYMYNMRDFDTAQQLYEDVRTRNPYVIAGMDTYSNILYVKGLRAELSHLAHSLAEIDRYRPETCCVIGNHYSLKAMHHHAVAYFQRALRLNRRFVAAWTLVGHEYLELKNTPGAIEAYRKAIDIDAGDHRAWYGLGQAYELLQMYTYAAYYYTKACALRPGDARMWAALANTYKQLGQPHDAIQCYARAEQDGRCDAGVLVELAQLHVQTGEQDAAASYYARYLSLAQGQGDEDAHTVGACLYLARYYKDRQRLADAEALATRVLRYAGKDKEDAKQLLHEIRQGQVQAAMQ
jgi:anaphase-promoting complex subunit 8